ncbi:hypothetical protein BS47DRAFT_1339929 [Hydnum rufescens UP504]|uniref:Uncharacterized protein n=1 Tax=Hydnum rufescens UP504 TaxID=1448309 RepID=A0A9P6B5A4_9AGAM|nr:hypothetical protein BS47DRAFT_1339929 [Hydnum rufescens UP504]
MPDTGPCHHSLDGPILAAPPLPVATVVFARSEKVQIAVGFLATDIFGCPRKILICPARSHLSLRLPAPMHRGSPNWKCLTVDEIG